MSQPSVNKIRVAVVCGGVSSEREISLKSGYQVLKHLDRSRYEPHLVEITTEGVWLLAETATPLQMDVSLPMEQRFAPLVSSRSFDVAFLALHGGFGEDGHIQALLDLLQIPYTGSTVLASALCMNKIQAQTFISGLGVSVPASFVLHKRTIPSYGEIDAHIKQEIQYPCILKPNQAGSSIGVCLVKNAEALRDALESVLREDDMILVQQYLKGREITCGVLGNATQGGDLLVLPPVEIVHRQELFDYEAKYLSEQTQELCPAPLEEKQIEEVRRLTRKIHAGLGCDGLTRSDFILQENTFYYLETNTLPGLTEQSLCPKEAAAAGMTFGELLGKQLELALEKR